MQVYQKIKNAKISNLGKIKIFVTVIFETDDRYREQILNAKRQLGFIRRLENQKFTQTFNRQSGRDEKSELIPIKRVSMILPTKMDRTIKEAQSQLNPDLNVRSKYRTSPMPKRRQSFEEMVESCHKFIHESTSKQEIEEKLQRKREIRKLDVFKTFAYAQQPIDQDELDNSTERNLRMVKFGFH
jgi:hypothetical protein